MLRNELPFAFRTCLFVSWLMQGLQETLPDKKALFVFRHHVIARNYFIVEEPWKAAQVPNPKDFVKSIPC
jgi:hypothetical protein